MVFIYCKFIINDVLVGFLLTWHKLESFGKRGSLLRKIPHHIGLQASLWAFSCLMTDRKSIPLGEVLSLGKWSCIIKKNKQNWASHEGKTRRQHSSMAYASVPVSKVLPCLHSCSDCTPGCTGLLRWNNSFPIQVYFGHAILSQQ